jgi:dTDP-4-dehydrorhamnose reductase
MAEHRIRIAVTGAGGQLGRELINLKDDSVEWIGWTRHDLDITDEAQCRRRLEEEKPDAVIHAAAYTAVDRAETDVDTAYRVNVLGTRYMAEAAEAVGAKFCYVSTDYVFDGKGTTPYKEEDAPNPQTIYGHTKRQGESHALNRCARSFVVRTSWVYGRYGENFVSTMLRLSGSHPQLKVVDDQVGAPTYTLDLARLLTELVRTEHYGIFHASNAGTCSWYEFAQAIFELSGTGTEVVPCSTAEFPRPAPRPAYSVLAQERLIAAGLGPMRHWRSALEEFLASYNFPPMP